MTSLISPQGGFGTGRIISVDGRVGEITLDDLYHPKLSYTPEDPANKGIANGYAELDGTGKVPVSQIPDLASLVTSVDARTGDVTLDDLYHPKLSYTPEDPANKGVANGYAGLDGAGLVPTSQLPTESVASVDARTGDVTLDDLYHPKLSYTPEDPANKGVANGYAGLDGAGLVPTSQLPDESVASVDTRTGDVTLDDLYHPLLAYTPANDANVVHLTGDETIDGKKTFSGSQTIFDGFIGINVDPPQRRLHLRGDLMQFDRDSPAPEFMIAYWDSGYTSVWKTFAISVLAFGPNNGRFSILDRGTTVGGGGAIPRMEIHNNGEIYFPAVPADIAIGASSLYIQSDGKIGVLSSVRESKINITPLSEFGTQYLDLFDQLEFVRFNYRVRDENDDYTDEAMPCVEFGLIAEDVEAINPEWSDYKDSEMYLPEGEERYRSRPLDPPTLKGVGYSRIFSVMGHKIQDIERRLKILEGS